MRKMEDIVNLYNRTSPSQKEQFQKNLVSNLHVKEKSNSSTYDDTWLVKMEETIRYLDNILRNPNRFIVNEEEIVKIELARRITVDSIKHLSRNTNLIQDYNQKTGEVRPSKILNINKEETFNTYENRFIYTLINNMKLYIERKKKEDIADNQLNEYKNFTYQGKGKMNDETVELSLQLTGKKEKGKEKNQVDSIPNRIAKVEERIRDLCSSDVYKSIAKLHVAPVTSPIKKTNLILKNVNFQYALDLWNFMQMNMEPSVKSNHTNKDYQDQGKLKEMMDQSFLLNCLIMNTMNEPEVTKEEQESLQEEVVNQSVNQLMNISDQLSLEELMKLVGDQYVKVKYKKVLDTSEIERIYKKAIREYMDKIEHLKVRKNESDQEDI